MPDTSQERRHLVQANRHIAECKALIARQQALVQRIAQRGQPTDWAEDTLHALKSSLRAFEAHRKVIVAEIEAARGRIFLAAQSPRGTAWVWTLAYGEHTPTNGYEPTREAAMAAFAKSWPRE